MRATVMYGTGDVRVESVPDARLIESTDALVAVTRASICGSDLWRYKDMQRSETGRRMGHEAIGVVEAAGADIHTVKVGDFVIMPFAISDGTCALCHEGPNSLAYIQELLPDVPRWSDPSGRVFDRVVGLEQVPAGYRAMNDRAAIKVMVKP